MLAPPLPPLPAAILPTLEHAFARPLRLTPAQRERATSVHGDTARLRRKLRLGEPLVFAAIGDSNVVRGGCHDWQRSKCGDPRYTNRTSDGSRHGWLLQAFEAFNHTWPNPSHRLANFAMMATGPDAFSRCLNTYVGEESDVVLIGFADMCYDPYTHFFNSTFAMHLESTVRELKRRPDPPAIVLFNYFRWLDAYACLSKGVCRYWEHCEAAINELAHFYDVSALSVRDAIYHEAHGPVRDHVPFQFMRWTSNWCV